MGVQGLWQLLTSALEEVNVLETFHGKTVAVDWMVWLHRAAARHAVEMLDGDLAPAIAALELWMGQLLTAGVDVLVVVDGEHLPGKAGEAERRAQRLQAAVEQYEVLASSAAGGDCVEAADLERAARLAAAVTADLIEASINLLRRHGVAYIVAPYESDPQLAWLACTGVVDAVLTVDSDVVVLGAPCIIRGVDQWGMGEVYTRSRLEAAVASYETPPIASSAGKITPEERLKAVLQRRGVVSGLRAYASLRGCDYVESPTGVGPVAVLKALLSSPAEEAVAVVAARLAPGDEDYPRASERAMAHFTRPVVLDVRVHERVTLDGSPAPSVEEDYLGSFGPNIPEVNCRAAMGHIHRGREFELQDVSAARLPGIALPSGLSEDEVVGAKLDESREWQLGVYPTLAHMKRFLRTRDVGGVRGRGGGVPLDPDDPRPHPAEAGSWDEYAAVCKEILAKERLDRADGFAPVVRDPDGGTLLRRLLDGGGALATAVRAVGGGAQIVQLPEDHLWMRGANVLREFMPKLSKSLIYTHLEGRLKGAAEAPRAMRHGNQLVAERTHHKSFEFHPGDGALGYIKYDCRASYSLERGLSAYHAWAEIQYLELQVVRVVRAGCTCKAAQSETCIHVVALLLVGVFFSMPCTSQACAWRAPTSRSGGNANVVTPVSEILIKQPRLPDEEPNQFTDTMRRTEHEVLPDEFRPAMGRANDPRRKMLRAELYKVLENDLGRKCAAETVWPADQPLPRSRVPKKKRPRAMAEIEPEPLERSARTRQPPTRLRD